MRSAALCNAHKGWCVKADPTDVGNHALQAQHRNLEQTGAANARAGAGAAILAGASTVHVAGFRQYPIAFGFHYLYRLFRDSVHLVRGDAGTLEMDLRALKPDDAGRCGAHDQFRAYSPAAILAGASTVHVAGFRPPTRSPSAFTICTVCSAIPCTWCAATPARWKWTCGP